MSGLQVGVVAMLWCVFAISAGSKLRAQRAFTASLRSLRLIPERQLARAAFAVTGAELVVVLGLTWILLSPGDRRMQLVAVLPPTALLLIVLTAGIWLALRHRHSARCACFGATERPLSRRHLLRNGLLLLGVLAALAPAAPASDSLPVALLGVVAGIVTALVLVRLDDIVELFVPTSTRS